MNLLVTQVSSLLGRERDEFPLGYVRTKIFHKVDIYSHRCYEIFILMSFKYKLKFHFSSLIKVNLNLGGSDDNDN